MSIRRRFLQNSIARQQDRLRQSVSWFPYPALISFILGLLFTQVITMDLNPRLGNPAVVLELDAPPTETGAIWMALAPAGKFIVATSGDRQMFRWPLNPSVDDLAEITAYLQDKIKDGILTSSLSLTALARQPRIIFACDLSLTYAHIRPLLAVLARVGITNFSFETRLPAQSTAGKNQSSIEKAY